MTLPLPRSRPGSLLGTSAVPATRVGAMAHIASNPALGFVLPPSLQVRKDDWIAADGTTLGSDNGGQATGSASSPLRLMSTVPLPSRAATAVDTNLL